jgi:PAS domain-containing protein
MMLPEVIRWSPSVFDLYGISYADRPIRLEELMQPLFPEDRARLGQLVVHAIRHRIGYHAVLRLTRPHHDVRLMEIYADVMVAENRVLGLAGTVEDITDAALASTQVHGSFEFVTTMACPAALLDADMRVLACSDAWLRVFALPNRPSTLGRKLAELVPKIPAGWAIETDRALAGVAVRTTRDLYEPSTNRKYVSDSTLMPWRDSSGKVVAVLSTIGQWAPALVNRRSSSAAR